MARAANLARSPTVLPSTPIPRSSSGRLLAEVQRMSNMPDSTSLPLQNLSRRVSQNCIPGLRSLCLVYGAREKRGCAVIRRGREGERRVKPLCVECISLWLNCVLPLVNSGEHFSGERHSKSSRLVNDHGPDGAAKPLLKSTAPQGCMSLVMISLIE